jgi:N-methylhydantoinase A
VTDAHVWLGRIPPDLFLGGRQQLDRDSVAGPLEKLAEELGQTTEAAAEGVLEVANTRMEGALRLISVERGYDPADLVLVAFGGAAPLHAVELAARLGVPRVLVPPDPGTLSARGILVADVRKDASRSVLRSGAEAELAALQPVFGDLEASARTELESEGVPEDAVAIERAIDARYRGQSYELTVPASEEWLEAFHTAHDQRFGFRRDAAPVEAVTVRVVARAKVSRVEPPSLTPGAAPANPAGSTRVYFNGSWNEVPMYLREALGADHRIAGPAIIAEYSSTTWLPVGWSLQAAKTGDLLLEPA